MRRTAPFAVVSVVGVLLGLLVVTASSASDVEDVADGGMLGSEQYLKQMIAYVTPLMAILRKDQLRVKRETTDPIDRDSYGYGGGGGGYESSYEPCCDDKQDYVAIMSLVALGLLFLFLITLLSTSTTGGRKKRSNNDNDDDEDLADFIQDLAKHQDPLLLDGPTWLSMVHELWEQDGATENLACAQETLCRMNRLAMAAPGQAGWAVSMSSLPLSYLLHTRHTGGFSSYMDAALMGRSGMNCTEIYAACPRLR